MTILAIDTSFDDTAVAVTKHTIILSNVLSTDLSLHAQWGGVVPNLARHHHQEHIDNVILLALKRAHITWNHIDAIAVTQGPGLAVALEVGIAKAVQLANEHGKPLLAVNHMEGHLFSFLAKPKPKLMEATPTDLRTIFPAMGILVSGGHTQFVYTPQVGVYEIVGQTQDDAIGECFDKVGRMLLLGYPAGRMVEQMAKKGVAGKYKFPVPMRQIKTADTSYSGLKTAAIRLIDPLKQEDLLDSQTIADLALTFQNAALTHLIEKLQFALKNKEVKSLIVGGGVAANVELRKRLRRIARKQNLSIHFPVSKKLCTDNAAMIGVAAYLNPREVTGEQVLERKPVWVLG